jgi:OmpA-OmpF porin, OOP family
MKNIFLAIAVLSVLTTTAMAEGFYGAVDAGQTKAKDMCSGTNFGGYPSCATTSTAFRIGGGYNFTQNFGAELSYGNLGNLKVSDAANNFNQSNKVTTLQAAITGTLPIANGFSVIGKVGVARTKFDENWTGGLAATATATKFSYGIGAQYDFLTNFAVRVEYEDLGTVGTAAIGNTGTGISKVTLLSAGLIYKF